MKFELLLLKIMKTAPHKLCSLMILFLFSSVCVAGTPPNPGGGSGPPADPPLPIDDNLYVLFVLALTLGFYFIYKHKLNQKTPI
jgi:hypothetical protein